MKRTIEQSKTFFKHKTNTRGLGRELYKTPVGTISLIIDSLLTKYPTLKNYLWVDPCAGDGRWMREASKFGVETRSFDLVPCGKDVICCDFFELDLTKESKPIFIIGNPPFTKVRQFASHALKIGSICYFLGGSCILTGPLSKNVELLHRFEGVEGRQTDLRSKVIFEDTNGKQVIVWCSGALFTKDLRKEFVRKDEFFTNSFRVAVKKFCEMDNRVVKLNLYK